MPLSLIHLKLLLPFQVFERTGVLASLPRPVKAHLVSCRTGLDCIAALVPGILIYQTEADGEVFVAVDEGVLVKTGPEVLVSTPGRAEERLGHLARCGGEGISDPGRAGEKCAPGNGKIGNWISSRRLANPIMDDDPNIASKSVPTFAGEVGASSSQAKGGNSTQGVWFGLGMMGLIGWSVIVPTLLGAALGIWLGQHHPGNIRGRWHCWLRPCHRLFECLALGRQGR